MTNVQNFYWDACVFISFLNKERDQYGDTIDDIEQYLREAKELKHRIYCSTITIAEVIPRHLTLTQYGKFTEFLKDYSACIIQIGADPIVMEIAAELKSLRYKLVGGDSTRKLLTPDAIHLASALMLKDAYNVELDVFHTFDDGKARGPEGKGMPLLSFERWCDGIQTNPLARRIIEMNRQKPNHPAPRMV